MPPKIYITMKELEENIDAFPSLRTILFSQPNLTAEFCVKYLIYNEEYASCDEDTYISFEKVVHAQPHLKLEDLYTVYEKERKLPKKPTT